MLKKDIYNKHKLDLQENISNYAQRYVILFHCNNVLIMAIYLHKKSIDYKGNKIPYKNLCYFITSARFCSVSRKQHE